MPPNRAIVLRCGLNGLHVYDSEQSLSALHRNIGASMDA
jgi:hypothetical protein